MANYFIFGYLTICATKLSKFVSHPTEKIIFICLKRTRFLTLPNCKNHKIEPLPRSANFLRSSSSVIGAPVSLEPNLLAQLSHVRQPTNKIIGDNANITLKHLTSMDHYC